MRYAEAVRAVRDRVREGVIDVIIEAKPSVRGGSGKARAVRQAGLDGLVDAVVDEIFVAAKPGFQSQLADMVALRLLSEVERRTTAGSA